MLNDNEIYLHLNKKRMRVGREEFKKESKKGFSNT